MTTPDITIQRLRKKLSERDKKIAGLQRRVAELDGPVASSTRFDKDVYRIVQDTLSNVRMIPIVGLGKGDRILGVKEIKDE